MFTPVLLYSGREIQPAEVMHSEHLNEFLINSAYININSYVHIHMQTQIQQP